MIGAQQAIVQGSQNAVKLGGQSAVIGTQSEGAQSGVAQGALKDSLFSSDVFERAGKQNNILGTQKAPLGAQNGAVGTQR